MEILKSETSVETILIKIKPKKEKMLSEIMLAPLFLGSCALFYFFNWVLIVNSRFLHPLYLLILFVVLSLLIHPSIYRSLFKASSYKMIWTDIVYIYKEVAKGIVTGYKQTILFFTGIYKKTLSLFSKSEQDKID
jgi:hypothetical protein